MPASLENGAAVLRDVPSFVSARAANTIISEDRPTRIQAETLLVLNGLLDELLLLILASAKSLATDRIKSDGMLKVLSNNLLAKDAVLEAELELRSYVDGKRAEGAKVPLGLMATSRLDGTDGFPVQSAFKALRLRCQFYSTLGDCDDDGLAKDQNIMSTDGRPIATVTQGVAIYVTALLEYVGQHVLQNVSRVIERDNSDEASLYDLRAAITEDEQLNPLYNKMAIKQELARRIDILEARRRKRTEDGARSGVRSDARVVKPWHVPTEGDFDEAAGPTLFSAKRASVQQPLSTASSSRHGHAASSSLGHADSSSLRASTSTLRTSSSIANHNAPESSSLVSSTGGASAQSNSRSSPARNASGTTSRSEASTGSIGRRQSSDRSWSGMFGSMKRRGSFKQGSDPNGTAGRPFLQPDAASLQASQSGSALDPDDDFEALMLSNQTMKVSLTPNRLHTIEVAKKGDDANLGSVRRRPGTAGLRDEAAPAAGTFGQAPSPSATLSSQMSDAQSGAVNGAAGVLPETTFPRPSSRASLQTAVRPERRAAPPPSSYRSPSPAFLGKTNLLSRDVLEEDAGLPAQISAAAPRRSGLRLQPRDDEAERASSNAKDLVDLFRSTPPSATSERFGSFGSDTASLNDGSSKKSAMGDRVRTLFGRKSTSSSGHGTPASPQQKTQRSMARGDTKPSLEGSQDTYVTSSTNNSMEQSRSLFSPTEAPFNRSAASRSSTSTSEHPTASADAAPDSKTTPDVTVVEPDTDALNGTNGLGIGTTAAAAAAAAAAGTAGIMAATRSVSHGSRSTSHASQTPSIAEGTIHDDTIADDASATSKSKVTEELVSRKVPWGYKRNSTNAGQLIERSGTPLSDRRRSIGYQSSNGHGVLPVRGASSAALSDNGHGAGGATVPTTPIASAADERGAAASASSAVRSANAPSAWSGSIAPASSLTRTRRSSFGARPSTANQARRPSAHLETIQLLAELERAMRNCHSVDECRALVQKAMHSDGTPLSPSASGMSAASGGQEADGDRKGQASDSAAGAVAPSADQSNVAPAVTSGEKTSSKEVGGAALGQTGSGCAITSLEQAEQGLVVAWLLGGDDDPEPRRDSKAAERVVRESVTSSGSGLTNGEADETVVRNFSLDSTASGKDVAKLASSSVVSLQSNYKDAQDEVAAE